jgi:LacI family transcriptional regulator
MNSTIKDVARKAGVAVSTVSLVMNKKGPVSKKTEKKVLQAIEELNYHPQRTARGLVTKQSGNFGFILSTDHFSQAEPFYTKIFLGAEFKAREYDYYLLLTTIKNRFTQQTIPRFLLERNVDGVILAGTVPYKIVEYISNQKIPLVLIDYSFNNHNYSAVLIDNLMGIQKTMDHLVMECDHRNIAFIGGDMKHPGMQQRCRAFRDYLKNHQLNLNDDLIICDQETSSIETGYRAANDLLERNCSFSAIVAANDAMAVGALRACRLHDKQIPEQIAITGFDNVESAITARPALTTIHVPKEDMGAVAVQHLVQVVNQASRQGIKTILPVELVKRESTQPK